ncbi:MAG: glycosyltransferase family 2 protein [Saccharofermentans sp.]|nr:glycosyltransferase family 2 protein [Saccharofermentans sp.]
MKILSVAIPCYNSQDYMGNAVESLLEAGDDIDIIIVDDGSTDDTALIADKYAEKYPDMIRVIHKQNGGHGSAVNAGIDNAKGLYFKVLDSDDRLDPAVLAEVMDALRFYNKEEQPLDMLVTNYVYDKLGTPDCKKKIMSYEGKIPEKFVCSWELCNFGKGDYLLMHSIIFRTQLLRDCGLRLPEHTFYVDNIYVYEPLLKVERIYYLNRNLYYYFIGREDQSVNEAVMIKRVDQQLKVNYLMLDYYLENRDTMCENKRRFAYMYNYLEIITTVSLVLLILDGSPEALAKRKDLLDYIYKRSKRLYAKFKLGVMGTVMTLPGKTGRLVAQEAYKLFQKFYGFN